MSEVPLALTAEGVFASYADIPNAAEISPEKAYVGQEVTITGVGFGGSQGSSYVTVGDVPAVSYVSWSDTEVKCYVPAGAVTGMTRVWVVT